jgi:hypothetical protein
MYLSLICWHINIKLNLKLHLLNKISYLYLKVSAKNNKLYLFRILQHTPFLEYLYIILVRKLSVFISLI